MATGGSVANVKRKRSGIGKRLFPLEELLLVALVIFAIIMRNFFVKSEPISKHSRFQSGNIIRLSYVPASATCQVKKQLVIPLPSIKSEEDRLPNSSLKLTQIFSTKVGFKKRREKRSPRRKAKSENLGIDRKVNSVEDSRPKLKNTRHGRRKSPSRGSEATAYATRSGTTSAIAISESRNAKAEAFNGSSSSAFAASGAGEADAMADTYGNDGGKATSITNGTGRARSRVRSRGRGNAESLAIAAGMADAMSEAHAMSGNSAARSVTFNDTKATSDAITLNGSSLAQSASTGKGTSRATSYAAGKNVISASQAATKGGNATSRAKAQDTAGNGESYSVAETSGNGTSVSTAITNEGLSKADALAEHGDSVANAVEGTQDSSESIMGIIGKEFVLEKEKTSSSEKATDSEEEDESETSQEEATTKAPKKPK